jgi:hypothetical protein
MKQQGEIRDTNLYIQIITEFEEFSVVMLR